MNSVLLLNIDHQPLREIPLERAVRKMLEGSVDVIEAKDKFFRSATQDHLWPSVVRLRYYVNPGLQRVALTRKNLLLRDDYTCQYCGATGTDRTLTVEHIQPKSYFKNGILKGNPNTWTNLVAACFRCNQRKRNRTPKEAGMVLRREPFVPKNIPWYRVQRNTLPEEWIKHLTLYNKSVRYDQDPS
jgi:5-methylcytosine-specific restriction endonuclease McrA